MKKYRFLWLALMMLSMCIVITGCGGSSAIYGRWKGSSVIYDGKEYTLSYLQEHYDEISDYVPGRILGIEQIQIVLTKAGNVQFTNIEGNTVDGCFTVQDDVLEFYRPTDKTDNLLLEYDGKSIRYTKDDVTYVLTK